MIFNNADKPSGAAVKLQNKAVEITANGSTVVTPDAGYGGLSKVDVTVDVPTNGAGINLPLSAEDIKANWDKIDLTEDITQFIDGGEPVVHEFTFPENVVFAFLSVEDSKILTALPYSKNDGGSLEIIFKYVTDDNEYATVFSASFVDEPGYAIVADVVTQGTGYYLTSCEPVLYYHTI